MVLFARLSRYSLYLRLTLLLHAPLASGTTTVRGNENASLLSPEGRSRRSILNALELFVLNLYFMFILWYVSVRYKSINERAGFIKSSGRGGIFERRGDLSGKTIEYSHRSQF